METIRVATDSRNYEIEIGVGVIEVLTDRIRALGAERVMLVSDTNVAPLYAASILETLHARGVTADICVLTAGEQYKTLGTVERLYHDFISYGLNRRCVIVALGGGIVGDVAGFAAATFMRGMPIIQVPTTLVALVDSSVGGKTGVNTPEGKNLVGAFHQPASVIADLSFLKTLPTREFLAGMAEVVKYYALGETELLPLLKTTKELAATARRDGVLLINDEVVEQIAALCCRSKAEYVSQDERDTGARAALNFGHTFGHAIEKHYGFDRYNHGEAVAIGMRLALEVGVKLGITPRDTMEKVLTVCELAGLDTALEISPRELVIYMTSDKKNVSRDISLVLLRDIGKPEIVQISPTELEAIL